ncbi:MAG: M1 family metallopeptidase, partial [Candidatus Solibacter usitatus]|nr:M1 family metallopeptidase [Candidatus Solibacter usitatus]
MPVALLLLLLPQGLGPSVYARDRTFDLQHVKLDIALDPKARLVSGSATLRLAPLNDGLAEVALDSVGLTIEAVTRDRRPLAFRTTAEQLLISLDRAAPAGTPLELEIRYVARPRKGLYFGERYAWSQGFPESQRHWFPVYDFPNDKATSELVVRAPAGWDVVSNGRLIEARDGVYHWLQDKPHSTYLISLAAGEFDRREESFHGIPLRYYVPRGQAANIPVSFGRTASAMEFFTTRIGSYPWDQFAQVVVPENLYGGMENTSAVTYSPAVLISPELVEDYQVSGDIVIAHELAHQWFGDLVSAEDFRGLWLSEGFATYFANLWSEHRHGAGLAAWERFRLARRITDSPAMQKYPLLRRPNDQGDPVGLLYSKGAWVLHMVRSQLGDTLFWKAIRRYVADYRFQNVRTADLLKAIAAATGRNLEWLFDQYVYEPGHPEFEVRWRWDGRVHVFVRQQARIFRLPVDIELDGRRHRIQVTREAEEFALEAPAKPRLVLFDPDHSLLKKLTFAKETAEWVDQLEHAPRTINRLEAIQAL